MRNAIALVKRHPIPALILLVEVCLLIYFNLFEGKNYMGYDASVYYLQTIETWEQKKLFLDNWEWQTTLCWDSPIILSALLYGILGDVFLSYGLSCIVLIAVFAAVLYGIGTQLALSDRFKLWFFCILFTPYLARIEIGNNLGYFFMMFFDSSAYLIKNCIVFFVLYVSGQIYSKGLGGRNKYWMLISLIAIFVSSMSSGFYVLVFGILPTIICYVICLILNNHLQRNIIINGVYLLLCTVITVIGKISVTLIYAYQSHDTTAVFTTVGQFWDNFFDIFSGIFLLTGIIPEYEDISIFSTYGIGYLFRILLIFLICCGLVVTIYSIKARKAEANYTVINLVSIILVNLLMLMFCYTSYGSPIFEYRYLIIVFIASMLLGILGVQYIITKNSNRVLQILMQSGLCISIITTNLYSYYYLNLSRYDSAFMQTVMGEVDKYDAEVVYYIGDDLPSWVRNIRVLDQKHFYNTGASYNVPLYWGTYTKYADAGQYAGPTILICADEDYQAIPDFIKNKYVYQSRIGDDTLGLYLSDGNPLDYKVGISGEVSLDYMYSPGICTANGSFDREGYFETNGTEGFATWGPYTAVPEGTYQFTLNYEVKSNPNELQQVGEFDVAVDAQRIAVVPLTPGEQSVTLEVDFDGYASTSQLEYRTYVFNGVQLKLKSIEIQMVNTDENQVRGLNND